MTGKLAGVLAAVMLALSPLMAWAAPTLSAGAIDNLKRLEARLKAGDYAAVEREASRQAGRLEGGNASDRWARALYLQLAASAESRRGNEAAAADLLAQARGISGVEPAQADRWLRQEAGLRARLGQGGQAMGLLGDWFQRHGGGAEDHWLMAQLRAEAEQWDSAADWVERALDDSASVSRQRLAFATSVLQRSGRQQAALAALEQQLAVAGDDPDAWRRAAGLAQRLGDPVRAAALWETAWRRGVLQGKEDLLQRIRLQLAAGTPARAAERLEQALAEGRLDDGLELRRLLAQAWEEARDRERALDAWRAVAEEGGLAEDWLKLGQLAVEWGRMGLAREALQRAQQGGAENVDAWLAIAKETLEADSGDGSS